ncbi:hypothetical protein AVEN_31911-1 [Araneus ventricosus]|uniref:MADF domain-containing protein n=1 Tax=Araneus ventricosus TaxID=182803 RepID=A0A4Y2KIJ6_ARAVE|nr:hypothetical protein AVEN_31911-1 [Araneus ventricosus]
MILEVEKYPYLYDSRHNDFKNRELKKDAWMAVTKNVIGEKWDQMDEKTRSNVGMSTPINCSVSSMMWGQTRGSQRRSVAANNRRAMWYERPGTTADEPLMLLSQAEAEAQRAC